jgi:hypothetical protein
VLQDRQLVLFLAGLLPISLARQCFLDAALFTGLQVVGVTFDFLDDVFLLNLPLKPAKRILKGLTFLYANLCQSKYTSQPAKWLSTEYGICVVFANRNIERKLEILWRSAGKRRRHDEWHENCAGGGVGTYFLINRSCSSSKPVWAEKGSLKLAHSQYALSKNN